MAGSVCGLDDERAGHPRLGVTGHGADGCAYVPGSSIAEPDPLGLARASPGVDVGEALDLPVVEDRVVVREGQHDRLAGRDSHVGRDEASIPGHDRDVVAPRSMPRSAAITPPATAEGGERRRRRGTRPPGADAPPRRPIRCDASGRASKPRSRSEFATTATDDSAIAAAAKAGDRAMPKAG